MGIKRFGGRDIEANDLGDSAVEPIKRDTNGNILYTSLTAQTTQTTSTQTLTASAGGRQYASNASIQVTEVANGTFDVTLSRDGSSVTNKTGQTTSTTFSVSNTFTASAPTWSLKLAVTAGTYKLTSWTQSVEQRRG